MTSDGPKPKTVSWKVVLALLLGFPIVLSFALSNWLGVPDEVWKAGPIFERLTLTEVPTLEQHSLNYGNLYFCRLRLKPEGVKPFYAQLEDRETYHGRVEPPIGLKLEREWWDPGETAEGTYFKYGKVTLWSPDGHPDLVYGVIHEGEARQGANNRG